MVEEAYRGGFVNACKTALLQTRALLVKNFFLHVRSWKLTLVQIFSPFIFVLILYVLQQLYIYTADNFPVHPPITPLQSITKCIPGSTPCITLAYSPSGVAEIDAIMAIVARRNGLTLGTNAIQEPVNGAYTNGQQYPANNLADIIPVQNSSILNNFILNNQNVTQVAVSFTLIAGTWGASPFLPLPYTVLFNSSTGAGDMATPVVKAVDEAIMEKYSNNNQNISIQVGLKGFPQVVPSLSAASVVGSMGALWFYCPPMFNFMILLNQIVTENELKLRLSMRTMGLKNSIYWFTWFITNTVINIFSALVLIGFGAAFQFAFFLKTNFLVLFLLFFLFSTSMVPLAFFFSAFLNSTKTASTVAFIVFVAGLLLQVMFTSFPIYYWYEDSTPRILQILFPFYAPFDFAKLFADINTLTQPQISLDGSTNSATGYTLSQLFHPFNVTSVSVTSPAGVQSMIMFIVIAIILLILAWYFDNVIPIPRRPVWFPFQPAYWGCTCLSLDDPEPVITPVNADQLSQMSPDAKKEMEAAINKTLRDGLRIININKRFTSYWSYMLNILTRGKVRDRSFQAVANMFLTVPSGECLALLGHNGAGKTTLVNMLTGLFPPTSGDAIIFGHSLRGQNGMDRIRTLLGVCPQHDILFPELTAKQHLELFADIKGIPLKNRKQTIINKLKQVNLLDVANVQAGRFSGGMKRRLSLAVSCIGDPRILFLDEPTTGLDPINKREVWDLIKEMKQNCIVILTTHSMAECEYLSDRIAIMAHGRIRCLGDALNLKNRFGNGYRVSLFVEDSSKIEQVKQIMQQDISIEDLALCAENSNYLQFTVTTRVMKQVFAKLEGGEVPSIKDWSFSHTSLEDVFLDVTNSADGKSFNTQDKKSPDTPPIQSPAE